MAQKTKLLSTTFHATPDVVAMLNDERQAGMKLGFLFNEALRRYLTFRKREKKMRSAKQSA